MVKSGDIEDSTYEDIPSAGTPPPGVPPQQSGRCTFYVATKNRYCRFTVPPGRTRCGAHVNILTDSRERIPCPLDPNHTVYADRLQQHLKICSKKRDISVVEQQPFFSKGVNAGELLKMKPSESESPVPVGTMSEEEQELWIRKITAAYTVAVQEVLGSNVDPDTLLELSVVAETADIKHAEKHDVQNVAITQLVKEKELAVDAVVIEYGCGRGGLAAAILAEHPGARCLLVDREPRRHKFENRQGTREESVLRLRMDIIDFDLSAFLCAPLDLTALPTAANFQDGALSVSSGTQGHMGPAERLEQLWQDAAALQAEPWPPNRILVCAKHLCGGGTDVALRSLRKHARTKVSVCIATCCHHRCDASSYVNVPFLKRLQLCESEEGFAQLVSTAGWGVGGMGTARDLSRRRVGMMTKRILDLGRVLWLRENIDQHDAHIGHYINKQVTPENVVIISGAKHKS